MSLNYFADWVCPQIGDVADVIAGGTPSAGSSENFAAPGQCIAWLTPADLSKYDGKYISHGARDLSKLGYESSSAKLMPKGSLLFSSRAPIGYVVIAANEIATNQGFKNFVFTKDIDSTYAYYFLKSIRELAESLGTGTTFKEISGSTAKTLPFVLPPLAEQQQIAQKLDELLAQVDTLKTRLDAIPNILKRFRQSVLAAAVSGRLTEEWREENIMGAVCPENIAKQHEVFQKSKGLKNYKVPDDFDQNAPHYDLPNTWRWFRAEQLCDLITKGTTPSKESMSEDGDIPYIKVYNLTFDGSLDFTIDPTFIPKSVHEKELSRSKVFPGDVLMNIVGPPLGKVSVVPSTFSEWNINQAISIFRPVCGVSNLYLSICLRNEYLLDLTKFKAKATVGQFNLTLEICRDFSVPVPPIEEQTEIVRRVEQLFAYADQIEQRVKDAQARVNHLTQSILAKAFRGELTADWRAQNPELISGENSAAALLERIRVEREATAKPKRKVK